MHVFFPTLTRSSKILLRDWHKTILLCALISGISTATPHLMALGSAAAPLITISICLTLGFSVNRSVLQTSLPPFLLHKHSERLSAWLARLLSALVISGLPLVLTAGITMPQIFMGVPGGQVLLFAILGYVLPSAYLHAKRSTLGRKRQRTKTRLSTGYKYTGTLKVKVKPPRPRF